MNNDLKSIRIIKDFPKKGIAFYDISTILSNPKIFNRVVNSMSKEENKLNAIDNNTTMQDTNYNNIPSFLKRNRD